MAFLFSTVVITLLGEIAPQGYFSRRALRMGSLFYPVLRFYQIVLYPVAKPTAKLLDLWLGPEGIRFFPEGDFKLLLGKHMESSESDIDDVEGRGALNFLAIDDLMVIHEGEPLDPQSVVSIQIANRLPVFPKFDSSPSDPFLQRIQASGKKWVILTDDAGKPHFVLDADGFLRAALFEGGQIDPLAFCHRPIVITKATFPIGEVMRQLKVEAERPGDDVIDKDIVLVWVGPTKRIITGADILGRLLRGIVAQSRWPSAARPAESNDKNLGDS
jgi:hypothetical protein